MQKKYLKNLALLIFLNLLVKPFWILGVDREVQNVVGTSEYGFYSVILNFSFQAYYIPQSNPISEYSISLQKYHQIQHTLIINRGTWDVPYLQVSFDKHFSQPNPKLGNGIVYQC